MQDVPIILQFLKELGPLLVLVVRWLMNLNRKRQRRKLTKRDRKVRKVSRKVQ